MNRSEYIQGLLQPFVMFSLTFMNKGDNFSLCYGNETMIIPNTYFWIFGFKTQYQLKVIDSIVATEYGGKTLYKMDVQYKKRILYWFNFKIYTYK